MNAGQFVNELAAMAPSIAEYKQHGLSAEEAASFRERFLCKKRQRPLGIAESNDLFALMNQWHTDAIEIGMIVLADAPTKTQQGTQVGKVEADPLLIHADGEMVVHELHAPAHTLWPVAKSPNDFLNAVVVAAKFLTDRGMGKDRKSVV